MFLKTSNESPKANAVKHLSSCFQPLRQCAFSPVKGRRWPTGRMRGFSLFLSFRNPSQRCPEGPVATPLIKPDHSVPVCRDQTLRFCLEYPNQSSEHRGRVRSLMQGSQPSQAVFLHGIWYVDIDFVDAGERFFVQNQPICSKAFVQLCHGRGPDNRGRDKVVLLAPRHT
jgi:hypothetical protein